MRVTRPSPTNATNSAGALRPGRMKSMSRIAAASRTAATNGAMRMTSGRLTGSLLPPQPEGDRTGLADGGERPLYGPVDEVEDEAREQPEDHDERRQRHQRQRLHGTEVGQVVPEALEEVRQLPERHPLEHPQ